MTFIPVNEPQIGNKEKQYILECLETGWISSEGPFIEKFEMEFSSLTSRQHSIAVSSGTGALDIAIESLEIEQGDEIIVPTLTIISCISHILRKGIVPIFIDCDPATFNMDVEQIESRITSKTRAIMAVHIYGLPVDMDPILSLARKYQLFVIEDAAQMIGQTYKGKPCGSFGDISTFSFYPNKHITTGEGGMITTNSPHLAAKCRSLRNLCFQPGRRFLHENLGWNYRMTNIQAAMGLAQLENLSQRVERKRQIGAFYNEFFSNFNKCQLPVYQTNYATNIYWVYPVVLPQHEEYTATWMMKALYEKQIGTRPFFFPLHMQPVLKKMGVPSGGPCPVSETISEYGLYLPSGITITKEQISTVCNAVIDLLS